MKVSILAAVFTGVMISTPELHAFPEEQGPTDSEMELNVGIQRAPAIDPNSVILTDESSAFDHQSSMDAIDKIESLNQYPDVKVRNIALKNEQMSEMLDTTTTPDLPDSQNAGTSLLAQ